MIIISTYALNRYKAILLVINKPQGIKLFEFKNNEIHTYILCIYMEMNFIPKS